MNLAIISPSQNSYSETFIQQHKKIKARISYYYGGAIPTYLEGVGKIKLKFLRKIFYKISKIARIKNRFSSQEYALLDSFKKNKIQLVLAEYGPTAVAVIKTCKKLNIPLVAHFHGYDVSQFQTIEAYRKSYFNLFNYASAIISVSNKMTEDLINLGCPKEKIHLSTYGPSPDFFEINRRGNNHQFVAVGRFVEKKAPHLTLAAFKQVYEKHPEAKLIMIGSGELLPICRHLTKLWGLENNVIFPGILTPDKVNLVLSESLAFVQHSITASNGDSEGTPVAILEASAASLPVVATKHAGIKDVIIHEKTGFLVEEEDVEGMATYMVRLIENPELAIEMGNKGRKNISDNFSLQQHLMKIEIALESSLH